MNNTGLDLIGLKVGEKFFNLNQFAFLFLTNDLTNENVDNFTKGQPLDNTQIFLTSKQIYYWAIVLSKIVETIGDKISAEELIIQTEEGFRKAVVDNQQRITTFYNTFGIESEKEIFTIICDNLAETFGLPPLFFEFEEIQLEASKTYNELVEDDLIKDPVDLPIGGPFSIIVLGLIPIGFSYVTGKGKEIKLEIKALLWEFEMKKEKEKREYHFFLKLHKILNALKKLPDLFEDSEREKNNEDEDDLPA
ncbi:hypothetical protein [Cyclobacterium sp. SYSU L10401]|uniref:hypothetical protein n=1 Tax=Cyclobacterium sp. SYSU L10401 TaxID=2678657 RepID=UPI0013D1C6EC|nr:hypothetical protein [Cyclobacterium sp. SYSU L10401]